MSQQEHGYTPERPLELKDVRKAIWWKPIETYKNRSEYWYADKWDEFDALGWSFERNFDVDYWREKTTEEWLEMDPQTEDEILTFYKTHDTYIPELSIWTYSGDKVQDMRQYDRWFRDKDVDAVLDYGAGVGDIVMFLKRIGYSPVYLDVNGIVARFFDERTQARDIEIDKTLVDDPDFYLADEQRNLDAIITNDVIEHIPDVERLIDSFYEALRPGGYAVTQWTFQRWEDDEDDVFTPCHLHDGKGRAHEVLTYMESKFELLDHTWNAQMRLWRKE